jgi:hypothetical protein
VSLDRTETPHAPRASVIVASDQNTEMQLGERHDADRRLIVGALLGSDQHRGIEQDSHSSGRPRIGQPTTQYLEVPIERGVSGRRPQISQLGASHPLADAGRSQLRNRATSNGDRELLSSLSTAENLTNVVPELLLGNCRHTF